MSDAALIEVLRQLAGVASTSDGAESPSPGAAMPVSESPLTAPLDVLEGDSAGVEPGNQPTSESREPDLEQ